MATTTARHHGGKAEEAWIRAEERIVDRIGSLTRWDAERWAAAHERQLPLVSLRALRASFMQAAINSDKDIYLETAFRRLQGVVTKMPWADLRIVDAAARPAVKETSTAVVEVAQHALVAAVLAEVTGQMSLRRQRQLELAEEKVRQSLPSANGAWPPSSPS